MKKLLMLLVVFCLILPVSANAPLVVDNAELLSEIETQTISRQLREIRDCLGIDVVVLTEQSIRGETPRDYADDYFDAHYGADGVLLLLVMDTRDWYISTAGRCIDPVDYREIGEFIVPYFSDGEYYEGFSVYAELVQLVMEHSGEKGEYVVDGYGNVAFQPHVRHWYDGLLICLIIGLTIGGISVGVMASSMKNVSTQGSAANYVNEGSLRLSCREDLFLYQHVTRRAKPKNTHTGSSGRSHGGGGGKF